MLVSGDDVGANRKQTVNRDLDPIVQRNDGVVSGFRSLPFLLDSATRNSFLCTRFACGWLSVPAFSFMASPYRRYLLTSM